MPDNADAHGAADRNALHPDKNSPDLVGEELGDGARIWRVYDQVAREEDRERIGNWNRGLDNLALFAGLFSAVTTAFIIQLQQDIQPDYARLSFLVLNASAMGKPFRDEPFAIDRSVRTTNCLWISSLMLSLTAALIAIMGKDWIGMYASRPICNPRQWAEIRTYRVACVERWYMSGVIASAPVLLHVSLVLFAAGLVIFCAPDPFSQRVALGLALSTAGLYLVTVISAVVFPTSPFKSPATQAVRGAFNSVCISLCDRLVYRPKRQPIAMLQQASLVIGAVLSRSLPADILPFTRSQRRRIRGGDVLLFWNHLLSLRSADQGGTWRDTASRVAGATLAHLTAHAMSLPRLIPSVLEKYRYRSQRPRPRPWHTSAQSCLFYTAKAFMRHIDLIDHWSEVRSQPEPILMAQSLSHLNASTQSTDVMRSILVALGDIAIGWHVAPRISVDLKSRLATEIGHNWAKVDLITLSRFILADRHLLSFLLADRAADRFSDEHPTIRSESIVFALIGLPISSVVRPITRYLPDIVMQPRTLQYLLPRVFSLQDAVVLIERYWDHVGTDELAALSSELRRKSIISFAARREGRYIPAAYLEDKLGCISSGSTGFVELLVYSLNYLPTDIITCTCALILKAIERYHIQNEPCVVNAFGNDSPQIANAAWAAVPSHNCSPSSYRNLGLELALPLDQFGSVKRWRKGVTLPLTDKEAAIKVCLARTIVRLLFPSRYLSNWGWAMPNEDGDLTYTAELEIYVRCLHTQLLHPPTTLDDDRRLEIVTLILENSVLIRICALWEQRSQSNPPLTTERNVLNILTAIARRLTAILEFGATNDYNSGAMLFCLFSYSDATDWEGNSVAWDLGLYLSQAASRVSEQDPGTETSMRRLLRALRTLRPLCAQREDLRAAWERINIPDDPENQDSFWIAEDMQLGPFFEPEIPQEESLSLEDTRPPVDIEAFTALYWLDAAMR